MKQIISLAKYSFFLFLSITLLARCNYSETTKQVPQAKIESQAEKLEDMAKGFHLIETNCFSCHSPNPALENRIAPSIQEIKKQYVQDETSMIDFTKDLSIFMNNPSLENSKMPDAIKQFNLMPKMSLSSDQVNNIARYIYNTQLERSDWYEKSYAEEKKKYRLTKTLLSPLEKGQSLALQTKAVLGKNLLNAIKTKGTENALSFCSSKAITLTDSMSLELNSNIKRVSDQNRNPNNTASADELAYMKKAKLRISNGEKPLPQINEMNNKVVGYYPIMTNKMCLQCHGQKDSEILPNTQQRIDELYPDDKAYGYRADELRGIWVIEIKE